MFLNIVAIVCILESLTPQQCGIFISKSEYSIAFFRVFRRGSTAPWASLCKSAILVVAILDIGDHIAFDLS